jgi:hypothetical protein
MFTELNIIQVANNNIANIDYPYEPGGLAVRTRWKKLMENWRKRYDAKYMMELEQTKRSKSTTKQHHYYCLQWRTNTEGMTMKGWIDQGRLEIRKTKVAKLGYNSPSHTQ